jgi:DNA polymerase-3 subunit beta
MKFTVATPDFLRSLSRVNGVVPSKSTAPILENILFDLLGDTLVLTATDMDISLAVTVQVKGKEDGRIAVPAKRLLDTVRSLTDATVAFNIDTTTNKIRLTTSTGEYTLTGENAKEFPAMPQFKSVSDVALDVTTLKRLIHRTAFAVSSDELRPAMMGVLLQARGKELRAVSTDGHRLVRVIQNLDKESGLARETIVPAKVLHLIARTLEGTDNTLSVSETHLRLTFGQTTLVARLIDETFPNYESVIPQDNDKTMIVRREDLLSGLRRVALYASATTHQVRFGVSSAALMIAAQDTDMGGEARETMPCEFSGETLEIAFNATYLMDLLTHIDGERVRFRFGAPTRAGIVVPESAAAPGEDLMMLVMPVRLSA